MSFVSTLVADLKFAVRNPATVRKATVGAATTVLGDIALLNTVVHSAPASVQVAFTTVTTVLTAIVVFLTPNADAKT